MAATEPIRSKQQLKALADYFLQRGQFRNYALVIMGAYMVLESAIFSALNGQMCMTKTGRYFIAMSICTSKRRGRKSRSL